MESRLLKDILFDTRDGDWGEGAPSNGLHAHKVIRGTDFSSTRYGDLSNVPIRYLSESSLNRRTLQVGDIIIETAGGSQGRPTGRTMLITSRLVRESDLPITCASFCRFLRVDPEVAYPPYVYWYLQYLYETGEMWVHQVQHTGLARFQYTKFAASTYIPLPPLPEQRAIAHILGTLDDKIELNRQMNATLEAIAQALFKSWFVDFDPVRAKMEGRQPVGMDADTAALFPDGFEGSALGEVPRGWRVGVVEDLGEVVCGKTPPTSDKENYGGTMHFITIPDMHNKIFVTETGRYLSSKGVQTQSSKTLPAYSICVSCIATAGLVAITTKPSQTNQQINSLIPADASTALYCYWALRGLGNEIKARGSGGSVTTNLNKGQFSALPVLIPTRDVMTHYQKMVSPLFEHLLANEKESSTLANIRDALLPKLLSGEIHIRDAERLIGAAV